MKAEYSTKLESSVPSKSWASSSLLDTDESVLSFESKENASYQSFDVLDYTVLNYNSDCLLKGKNGKYLTATQADPNDTPKQNSKSITFLLSASGYGVGDLLDCIHFIHLERK